MSANDASSRDNPRSRGRFGLGLAVGALAAFIVARQLRAPRRMPSLALWQRALAEDRGDAEAARLIARAQTHYDELYAGRPRLANRALRLHLERSILPGLAMYRTLLEESADQERALAEMESLMTSSWAGLRRLMPLLGRLPEPFAFFRPTVRWVVRLGFPAEGWGYEPVEDSDDCFAYDIRRCFYLDTLESYGAAELTQVYCGEDDTVFGALPPCITWERTMTLGRGHDRCNFRWCRAQPEGTASGTGER
jgi:hypothetical protein